MRIATWNLDHASKGNRPISLQIKQIEKICLPDEQLVRSDLICLTEEDFGESGKISVDPQKGYPRNNIDHICVTKGMFTLKRKSALGTISRLPEHT